MSINTQQQQTEYNSYTKFRSSSTSSPPEAEPLLPTTPHPTPHTHKYRNRCTTFFRSLPYGSGFAFGVALSAMSTAIHGWNTLYADISLYVTIPYVKQYEHWLILAFVVPSLVSLAGLVIGLLETGAFQEFLCASQSNKKGVVARAIGRLLALAISIAAYVDIFANVALFAVFAAFLAFKLGFDYACDSVEHVSESTCIDLSQFGLGDDVCGPNFTSFCADLTKMNPSIKAVLGGILGLLLSQIHVLVCQLVNYNRVKDRVDKSRQARVARDSLYAIPRAQRPILVSRPSSANPPTNPPTPSLDPQSEPELLADVFASDSSRF